MLKKLFLTLLVMLGLTLGIVGAQENATNAQASDDKQTATNDSSSSNDDLDSLANELGDEDLGVDKALDEGNPDETSENNSKDENLDEGDWGYKDTDKIDVKEVGPDYVVLQVPVVKDGNGNLIKQYKVYYSTKSLAENIDASEIQQKIFTFDEISEDTVELKVDGLSPNTTYYAVVVPVNGDDIEGNQSKEISFTTKQKEEKKPEHPAPEVVIKNVSYSISGNKVTVKWSPVQGADKIELYYKSLNDSDYQKLATVDSKTTSYSFDVAKPGMYQVKLIPVASNGEPVGKDYILSVKVTKVVKKASIKKAPHVGPATDLIVLMLILASLGYGLVRFRRS